MLKNTYFELNKNLSNSKIGDYLKDPYYFYQRHITGEVKPTFKKAFQVGKAVDIWLTESESKFREKYVAVARRNLKNPPEGYTELAMSDFNNIVSICQKVEQQQVYKDIIADKYVSQEILRTPMDLGKYFDAVCGIPDWYKILEDGTCSIIDLKTSESIDARKYSYHCNDYGYYRQQAMYQILLNEKYNGIKNFISRHLVVEKDSDGINKVALFVLDQKRIESEKEELFRIFEEIKNIDEYKPQNLNWEDAILI